MKAKVLKIEKYATTKGQLVIETRLMTGMQAGQYLEYVTGVVILGGKEVLEVTPYRNPKNDPAIKAARVEEVKKFLKQI